MVRKLIDGALANPLIVLILTAALAVGGGYAFTHVNIEAYPDPAPAIIEVVAQFPGASAEEVERQVTVPLEVALAGMPGLETTRSKSLFGLSHVRNQFTYEREYEQAKQDVLNRLATVNLPNGVTPQISPASPIGEILRYTLFNPRHPVTGAPLYTLSDLKAVQEYTIQRELLRVPRVAGVTGVGGTVKRYEVQPDPHQLAHYGVSLAQLQAALGGANANGSGDNLTQGQLTVVVRSLGLIGQGQDPQQQTLSMTDPVQAAAFLRAEETRRVREIRQVVVASVNNVPVRVDHLVVGGPKLNADGSPRVDDAHLANEGVVVGYQTRQGRVAISRPLRSRPWDRLTAAEQREALAQSGLSAPPPLTLWEELVGLVRPRPPVGPQLYRWWEEEDGRWQWWTVDARKWAELTEPEKAEVRAAFPQTPDAERERWRFYKADGKWDGWDDERWADQDDVIQGIVLLRKGQESMPALTAVLARIDELNKPGHLPPGMRIVPFYNRTTLIDRTTETVHENLLVGMALVTAILLMFLGNVRAAVIVAINIPLALLFAFGVLYARGRSANLLSIGAVDFGIIVDSSVIIVESIYRNLSTPEPGRHTVRPVRDRILAACGEVSKSLFFATVIMVCALLPLFTMKGPEGQIFGPMADTYAFALAGALVLAVTVSPVLCLLLMKHLKPKRDNLLVRTLQWLFLAQLRLLLRVRLLALAGFVAVLAYTGVTAAAMGREFMPELEEGNLMVHCTSPVNVSFAEVSDRSRQLRALMRKSPEFAVIVPVVGRPDDGTDPTGYYNLETFLPLRPQEYWPADPARGRPRTKGELVADLQAAFENEFPGVDIAISQIIRDNVMEALSGVKGENSIKVFGPDLDALEATAFKIRETLNAVPGIENAGVFRTQGQSTLEFPVDRQKCARWNVSAADVQAVVQTAVGGKPATQVQEGGKLFDLTVRWPERLRADEQAILAIPVPVAGNQVTAGGGTGLTPVGTSVAPPALSGSVFIAPAVSVGAPVRRLSDLVTPLDANGRPDPSGSFLRPGASTIYREQGQRLIAIKFEVRGRDLASTVSDARAKVEPLLAVPYRAEWSGEFKQMEEAEQRMARMFAVSLVLIVLFLYLAFHNWLDTLTVLANVLAMGVGGVWALKLAGLNFNISAAVGFISILGVAVMNGLLFVSAFNGLRAKGVALQQTLLTGTGQLVRPVVMTALAAILGLLPAAVSTKMGSESQRPLAVVVVGGMLFTVFALNLVPVLYSFYGNRPPPAGAGDMAH
ncbi:MAG: efflux RND transporter permease subunit [Gemmataceae bacterium]